MSESSKDKRNWIACAITVIGLVFIIIGVSVAVGPMTQGVLGQGWLAGLLIAIGIPVLIIVQQGTVIVIMYLNVKKKAIIQHKYNISTKGIAILVSVLNIFFILLSGVWVMVNLSVPMTGQLMFLAPFITTVAGIIFKDYK